MTPGLTEMVRRLVAAESVSSLHPALDRSNRAVIELLAGWLRPLGFTIELLPVARDPDKLNLVARLGDGSGGLVLAGHTDTVPFAGGDWRGDPLTLREHGGRLHGLGTTDMKSFLALAVRVAADLEGEALAEPLYIVATADEETTMAGARALARAGVPRARWAVIGEPTGLIPVRAHKGMQTYRLRVIGRAGHSSDPAAGASAIEGMHGVIAALLAWRDELQQQHLDRDFTVPFPTLNFGRISGGDSPNRICPDCELELDLRALPGMPAGALAAALWQRAEAALAGSPLRLQLEPTIEPIPAFATSAGSPLVRAAEAVTGAAATTAGYATEAPFFQGLGMETLLLGPGNIAQAHAPDESIAVSELERGRAVLAALARGLIGES